jgi:hypothetical protein
MKISSKKRTDTTLNRSLQLLGLAITVGVPRVSSQNSKSTVLCGNEILHRVLFFSRAIFLPEKDLTKPFVPDDETYVLHACLMKRMSHGYMYKLCDISDTR